MEKFNNKIKKHLELSEIAEMLKEYRKYYDVYRRLLVIHMVAILLTGDKDFIELEVVTSKILTATEFLN